MRLPASWQTAEDGLAIAASVESEVDRLIASESSPPRFTHTTAATAATTITTAATATTTRRGDASAQAAGSVPARAETEAANRVVAGVPAGAKVVVMRRSA